MRIGHLGERESLSEGEDASDRAFTQQDTLEVFVCPIFEGILCRGESSSNPTEMLEISDEESNLDDADSPKKPPPSSHNLGSPRNHRRTLKAPKVIQNPQPAQPTMALDTETNERFS